MRNECKCTNPDGGGTKCPTQHVAICIRGKDKQCYGECVSIPHSYRVATSDFKQWLVDEIEGAVRQYAVENYADNLGPLSIIRITQADRPSGGGMTFRIEGGITISVQYSYSFRNNIDPLGRFEYEVEIS